MNLKKITINILSVSVITVLLIFSYVDYTHEKPIHCILDILMTLILLSTLVDYNKFKTTTEIGILINGKWDRMSFETQQNIRFVNGVLSILIITFMIISLLFVIVN